MPFDTGPFWIALGRRLLPDCVWEGRTEAAEIALTFDDGPDPGQTPRVLELLERFGAQATFFWLGSRLVRAVEVCRQVVAAGHAVGIHGEYHRSFLISSDRRLRASLDRVRDQIGSLLVRDPATIRHVRPPYGHLRPGQDRSIASWGYRVVQCSILPGDWAASPETVVRRVLPVVRPGSIIALHDGGLAGRSAEKHLALLLPRLRDEGFRFVTVDAWERLEPRGAFPILS